MRYTRPGVLALMIMLLSATGLLAQDSGADDLFMGWSPDSTTLLFQSTRQGTHDLYTVNADGTGLRTLTYGQEIAEAVYSPDGQWIAMNRRMNAPDYDYDLYVLNVADGTATALVEGPSSAVNIVWSPDSTHLLVVNAKNYAYDDEVDYVLLVDVTTGEVLDLLSEGVAIARPYLAWSPDGSRFYIAGNTYYDGRVAMDIYQADGSAVIRDLFASYDFSPDQCCGMTAVWSPDGTRLAVTVNQDSSIYIVEPDAGTLEPLVKTDGAVFNLAWSEDGRELRYFTDPGHTLTAPGHSFYRASVDDGVPHLMGSYDFTMGYPYMRPDWTRAALFPLPDLINMLPVKFVTLPDTAPVMSDVTFVNGYNGGWSPDGRLYAASICVTADADMDVYVFEPETGHSLNLTADDASTVTGASACGVRG